MEVPKRMGRNTFVPVVHDLSAVEEGGANAFLRERLSSFTLNQLEFRA